MKINILAAVLAAATFTTAAQADDWAPPGPITLRISFGAGGGSDTQARLIVAELEDRFGWTIIPENVPGRGGLTMSADLMDAANDGTVIGMGTSEVFAYGMQAADTGWSLDDFTPLVTTAAFQTALVSAASSGWTTVDDMFAAARAGQTIRFGAPTQRLADLAFLLGDVSDIEFNIVSTQGGGPLMNALMAGDLDVGFLAGAQGRGVAAGDLVNLASALSVPLTQTPDAPLLSDRGLEFTADGYFMFYGPADMPEEARAAIANAIADVVSDPSNPAGEMIARAFGSATVLQGDELDGFLARAYDSGVAFLALMNQ